MKTKENQQRERILTEIHEGADAACRQLARHIAGLVLERAGQGKHSVLGLATGSTPVRLYRELIRMHQEEGLSLHNVITFNLDEYYGLGAEHPESYRRFMQVQLFDHVDIPPSQIHIPDGLMPRAALFEGCRAYEERIRECGGIDLQVLGIGRTGHIGFNEPGWDAIPHAARLLDALTRRDAARDFLGEDKVPRHAITMGIGTILEAREIVLLAWGEAKARVLAQAVEQPPSEALPASLLQGHPRVRFLVDPAAAGELTRVRRPWLVGLVDWEAQLTRRAVTWLCSEVKRPLLKLVDEHYGEHGMADLLAAKGPAYDINIRIFNETQHTITGWPGGKPNADDSHRPSVRRRTRKRVAVFAPEPSDEMLGMGGTLARLAAQGHEVTVVYMTSGNLAVPDEEAASAADLLSGFIKDDTAAAGLRLGLARECLSAKAADPARQDCQETRALKALLRRSEAAASLRVLGLPPASARFLDLPFYEAGRYRQFKAGAQDQQALVTMLRELRPHQIFATGLAQDPSSVGALCFELLEAALSETSEDDWWQDCRVWLYRTPDKEWAAHEIDMAVPMSPDQLAQKLQAIYQHKTQRSQTPARGDARREPWAQAEHSARELARMYDALGMAEYEAIEAFSRYL